jgi:hypothetical protein
MMKYVVRPGLPQRGLSGLKAIAGLVLVPIFAVLVL